MIIMEILHIILWVSTFLATIHGCSKKKRPSEPKPKPAIIKGEMPAPVAANNGSDGEKKSKEKEMKSKEMVTKSKEKEIKSKEETKSKEEVKKPPTDFSEALKHEKTYNKDLTVEEVNKTAEQKPEPTMVLNQKDPTIETLDTEEDEYVRKRKRKILRATKKETKSWEKDMEEILIDREPVD